MVEKQFYHFANLANMTETIPITAVSALLQRKYLFVSGDYGFRIGQLVVDIGWRRQCGQIDHHIEHSDGHYLQLDWSSETETLKINFPQDREGYDRFEYTYEKLSTRHIEWCGDQSSIFIFGVFLKNNFPNNFPNNDNGAWLPT